MATPGNTYTVVLPSSEGTTCGDRGTALRTDGGILPTRNLITDQNNHGGNKMLCWSYWKTNYKQLLIGIIGGCLLTLLIVVPAVYVSIKSNFKTDTSSVQATYIPLKFDQSTLHRAVFMSIDGSKLSNTLSRDTPVTSAKNPSTLSKYKGVIGNRCIDKNSKMYYEIQYEVSVIDDYGKGRLIFEVGLAERNRVDDYHYVGSSRTRGWSYYLHICRDSNNTACIKAQHLGKRAFDELPWHQVSLGSQYSGKFRFIVNRIQETFSIVRNNSSDEAIIHSFHNVYSSTKLCPVFAVYNADEFEVKITLSNTYDFSEGNWNAVII